MTEILKTKKNLNPSLMRNIFTERDSYYSLRSENHLLLPKANTMIYCIDNIQNRGCLLWSSLPNEIKILTHSLSTNGKYNYGKEIFSPADFAKSSLRI